MLNITINHNIYLTREERYAIHNGEELSVVGICIPVWFHDKKTSEPAQEVFCNYHLYNPLKDIPIQTIADGFEVYLPMRKAKNKIRLTNDEWRVLNQHNPKKLNSQYKAYKGEISSKLLLDHADGGCGAVFYREHNKVNKDGKTINMMHYVNIDRIERLKESIT
jgi:hypothetical protein